MDKLKIDEFRVFEKGKEYSVLVFPKIEYMWVVEGDDKDDTFWIDAAVEGHVAFKYAMAILAEASDKIIYFPCKQKGLGGYYSTNYNLILCTPKVQLRRSLWPSIRRKLNDKNKRGKYVLHYNRKKLDDFCEKKLMVKESHGPEATLELRAEIAKKMDKDFLEEIIEDNYFVVLGKENCIDYHYRIAKDLDKYDADNDVGMSIVGRIFSQKELQRMSHLGMHEHGRKYHESHTPDQG